MSDPLRELVEKWLNEHSGCIFARQTIHSTTCYVSSKKAAELEAVLDAQQALVTVPEEIVKWRKWWLALADEAESAGTKSGAYNARVYRDIIADYDAAISRVHL